MPFAPSPPQADVVRFEDPLDTEEIRAVSRNAAIRAITTNKPVRTSTWEKLDDELFARRPDIRLVVSGAEYDLSFAAKMKHVRRFAAHPVWRPTAIESIARMPRLELLSLHAYFLDSLEFLRDLPTQHLESLWLGQTKSKKPSLAPLARFEKLRALHIEFQNRDLEMLGELRALEDLTLRSVTTPDLEFLRPLTRLRSLDLKLGSIADLSAIAGKTSLQYLELWQVKGVTDVEIAAKLPGLQHLFLQSLARVKRLPSFARNEELRRVHLQNMKALGDVSSLITAPVLEELVIYEGTAMNPDDFEDALAKKSLVRAVGAFGSRKKNERFASLAARHGVREITAPFRFRPARSGRS